MAKKNTSETYTYRNGKKVVLYKKDDEFVARAQPEALSMTGATLKERVSPRATRMHTAPERLEEAMTASRAVGPTHHAYYQKTTNQSFDITDRILVTFKAAPSEAEFDTFINKYALQLLSQYDENNFLFQLTNNTGINPVKLVVAITENEPSVAVVEHDLNMKVSKYDLTLPTDPRYPEQWHLHTRTSPSLNYDPRSSARCEEAWQLLDNFGRSDVVIAFSDDGCRLNHPDFDSPNKFAAWGYFQGSTLLRNIDINANPSLMFEAGANHGTSCGGVIAGEADGVLTVGACPNAKLLPIKWESSGSSLFISDSKLLTALTFIADKADVFSNSWGMSPDSNHALPVLNRIAQLSQTGGRRGKGIVFLWAAGNENCPIQHSGNIDIPFSMGWEFIAGAWQWVGVETSRSFTHNLASLPGVMYVAALASNAQRSHYSNYGPGVSICAPSSNVHSYHRMSVRGLGVTTTEGDQPLVTDSFGGTSSATPLVAGVAGLVISANPSLTAAEVISILKQTASKDLNFTAYAKTPPAQFDPNTSWDVSPVAPYHTGQFSDIGRAEGTWSPWFGHGKVDARKAVEKAIGLIVSTQPIRIVSALINPAGADTNRETVTLHNPNSQPVAINGWVLANQSNKKQILTGSLAANAQLTVNLVSNQLTLRNTGGSIALLDANGAEQHRVSYSSQQVISGAETIF